MVYCLFFCNGPGSQTAKLVVFQNKIQDEVSFGVCVCGGGSQKIKKGLLLFTSHRPAILPLLFSSECLDSFIQGKIFLFAAALLFCCFDLRGGARSGVHACSKCACAAAWRVQQPKPVTSAEGCLKKRCCCCWRSCTLLFSCISMKCAPCPPPHPCLTFWRSTGSQMSHGRFPESLELLA